METISFLLFEMQLLRSVMCGALETPREAGGLHLIEAQQVGSETLHCFPLREHHLSNKQMFAAPGR